MSQFTPVVVAEPEAPNDRRYRVRIKKTFKGSVVGEDGRVYVAGDLVDLNEERAVALIRGGHGDVASPIAHPMLWAKIGPALAPPAPRPVEATPPPPNCRILRGTITQDGRTYGKGESLHFRGDIVKLLAMDSAEPGTPMDDYARRTSQNRAVVELIGSLGDDGRQRLARLRRNPSEAPSVDGPISTSGCRAPAPPRSVDR